MSTQPPVPPPSEIEAQKIASSFKPQWKPVGITVGVNLLLAALLLGLPYWRGRELALEGRAEFARFAQCMLGGRVAERAGLGMPSAARDHFAQNVLYAKSDWPLRCRQPLQKMQPPDAIFLWPSIKRAGADLRAVLQLLDQELVTLHRSRSLGGASIPTRPLDAIAKLQAAMTLMTQAAGVQDGIDEDVVRFDHAPKIASPARLPIYAGQSALLELTSHGGVVEALAVDGRGLSWLRLDSGKIDRERVKRAPLMRAVLHAGTDIYAVSATSSERCREREDNCSSRATGLGLYPRGGGALPAPVWLAGHPASRPERVLRILPGGRVDLVARGEQRGDLVLRRFDLPQTPAGVDAPPLAASSSVTLLSAAGESDAVLLPGDPVTVAWAHVDAEHVRAGIVSSDATVPAITLEPVAPGAPFVLACRSGGQRFVTYGSTRSRRVARVDPAGAVTYPSDAWQREVPSPVHDDDAALDRIKLVCGDRGAEVYELDKSAALWRTACPAASACDQAQRIADGVATFAVLVGSEHSVVAFSGTGSERTIRVLRVGKNGALQGPAVPVAACFEPHGGMCGIPTLVQDGPRLVLAAREDSDLLVLESGDGGAHFETLSGFKVSNALDTAPHDPMQQHRIRKGIQ